MRRFMLVVAICGLAGAVSDHCTALADDAANATIDLAGAWHAVLDHEDRGMAERWFAAPLDGDDTQLPGSLRENGLGSIPSPDTKWIGAVKASEWDKPQYAPYRTADNFKMPFWLQPTRHYVGPAWFQRTVEIPEAWAGKRIVLRLERPHWHTTVWVDAQSLGACDSLSTAHVYDASEALTPGRHRLSIRVENSLVPLNVGPNAHSVSDQTQSAWNGIVGQLVLQASAPVWIENVQVYPDITRKTARLVIQTGNRTGEVAAGTIAFGVRPMLTDQPDSPTASVEQHIDVPAEGGEHSVELSLGPSVLLWDEFTPHRYALSATLRSRHGEDRAVETFGMREVTTRGSQIVVNGRPVFLRGTLECCIFPLSGYPPTDVASWKRILEVCRAYGLNHMRFHSWCPPEAAFEAADELGFYFQVECSTWPNSGVSLGAGDPIDTWLYREADRILAAYGNHPSFLLLASGNEPAGAERGGKFLGPWVKHYRQKDGRRLVTSAGGWPAIAENAYHVLPQPRIQGWGQGLGSRINAQPPETTTDYRDFVAKYPDQPVVSHEIGQWCVYPNFDEIPKYTGTLHACNFEVFREFLENAGMLDQARDFLMASGRLQTLCYKEEIESALRTPGFGGFQLLDLHDFPGQGTALVGVVDPFWDPKPYVSPSEYSRFCNSTAPLARLPKRTFTADETLTTALEVSHFGPTDLHGKSVRWSLADASSMQLASGSIAGGVIHTGRLNAIGNISVPLQKVKAPARLKLSVTVQGTAAKNDWDLWVYPATVETAAKDVHVAHRLDERALRTLAGGGKVLLLIDPRRVKTDVALGFSSIFWNTAWTNGQPPHTLGILCDPAHPALAEFPTEYHSNWQWWEIIHDAATMEMDAMPAGLKPIVQVVPNWFAPKRLGLAFEGKVGGGKLLVCSMDLATDLDRRPVARQMRRSLLGYMNGDRFQPQTTLEIAQVQALASWEDGPGKQRPE